MCAWELDPPTKLQIAKFPKQTSINLYAEGTLILMAFSVAIGSVVKRGFRGTVAPPRERTVCPQNDKRMWLIVVETASSITDVSAMSRFRDHTGCPTRNSDQDHSLLRRGRSVGISGRSQNATKQRLNLIDRSRTKVENTR